MTNRTPIIAGNWKMHNTLAESEALITALTKAGNKNNVEIIVAPSYTSLAKVAELAKGSDIQVSAQDVHWEDKGAFTSAVSPVQAKDAGATHTLIGHSERRSVFGDTDEILNKKVAAALRHGIKVIFCVGETLEEREANKTLEVIENQLKNGLKDFTEEQLAGLVIAYEPVWAIGTGKTATPEQAQEVHATIRAYLAKAYSAAYAEATRILYGGSVKDSNVDEIMAKPDVDGALVGGQSLIADKFARIINFN
ncbi:MAG: triose-phosphate isomerase [Elusimicrobium sp.]|uniref:Triosephosphate isomerase n=1 Tax=Candidatus Avelusimicrobium gallicola TaxID=2562704 RepID=A0A928HIA3_9BACT|nr:triose-phosphate isomerase [Elusimicrobium sp.]